MEPILESVMNKKSSISQSDQIVIQPLNSADYDNLTYAVKSVDIDLGDFSYAA